METTAYGINNNGQIVGQYIDSSNNPHGFLYSGGVYTTLDDPDGIYTTAYGINDAGMVVGSYSPAINSNTTLGFLYDAGAYSTLEVSGAPSTFATGINNSGTIVGYYFGPAQPGFSIYGFETVNAAPEPGTLSLFAMAVSIFGGALRKKLIR